MIHMQCQKFVDSIIKGKRENDQDTHTQELVEKYQTHSHTFTCNKKKRAFTIGPKEGHGKNDGKKAGPSLKIHVCRFGFPKPPMRRTKVIEPLLEDASSDQLKESQKFAQKIRNYLCRTLFQEYSGQQTKERNRFFELSFDEFLVELGLREDQYYLGLRSMNKSKGVQVFLQRDCKDVFTNNYNERVLQLHQANIDCSYITDEYQCAAYILSYLTKNEAGMSKLLKAVEEEAATYGKSIDDKLTSFARVLDNSREVSIQEIVYRTLGLNMCVGSRIVKYINASKPEKRDGLLKSNLDELSENDNPFFNSIIDYYSARPHSCEELSLAEFAADYDIVTKNGTTGEHLEEELQNDGKDDEADLPRSAVEPLLSNMGFIRKRGRRAVIRYYLDKHDETEMKRNLLMLFTPFRDENTDIHRHTLFDVDELFQEKYLHIEEKRKMFEPHRELLVDIETALAHMKENDEFEVDSDEGEDEYIIEETTKETEMKDFVKDAKKHTGGVSGKLKLDMDSKQEVLTRVRLLNQQQRKIFDEIMERLWSNNDDKEPFYIYIAGEAGKNNVNVEQLTIFFHANILQLMYIISLFHRHRKIVSDEDLDRCI